MKHNFYIVWILILVGSVAQKSIAQEKFDDLKREAIADNTELLMQEFATSLKFEINVPDVVIRQLKQHLPEVNDSISQQYIDSIYYTKVDSLMQIGRETQKADFYKNFFSSNKDANQYIVNFAFDTVVIPEENLMLQNFAEKYFGLYNKVDGEFEVNYSSKNGYQKSLRPYLQTANIENHNGGNKVLIPFKLGWLQGTYDTTGPAFLNLPDAVQKELQIQETYNSREKGSNIELLAWVFFKNPNDPGSFKLLSLNSPQSKVAFPELQAFLETGVIKNLKLYGRLNLQGAKPDSTLIPEFLNLFNIPDKKSVQCSLFFSETVCNTIPKDPTDSINISPVQYCENVLRNYDYVGTYNIDMVDNALQVKKEKNFFVVKWPAKIEFIPRDFNDNTPDGLGNETLTNFYFKVDYSSSGLLGKSNSISYKTAKITDIAAYDKTEIIIPQPTKKGSFMIAAHYNPMYYRFQVDKNSAFKDFAGEFNISHGVGIDVGYYWFGKQKGRLLGIGTGISHELIKSAMILDSTFYAYTFSGNENPLGTNNVKDYEEWVWVNSFRHTINVDFISIPVVFNYMVELESKTLFNLGVGAKISILNKSSVNLSQTEGTTTHKGWYQVDFPDGTSGEYIIENPDNVVDGYGYVTNKTANIADFTREVNSTVVFLAVNPSFSIPISEKNNNLYLDLGLNFQYGLNTVYKINSGNNYIMESPGNSNSVYSGGVKKNDFVIGLSVGFRYFNNDDLQKEKVFKF